MTADRVREVLDYYPLTGVFRWRVSPPRSKVKVGDIAGCVHKDGYRLIRIDGRLYRASRLAWLYFHGHWGEIDHKYGVHDGDRLENLRDVTHAGNQQNQRRAHSGNKTGMLGVSPVGEKFQAQIRIDGKGQHLGTFETVKAAHTAYLEAKRRLHPGCTI